MALIAKTPFAPGQFLLTSKAIFVMTRYSKGANAERELIHELYNRGFSVVRVAGSGKTALPAPDIIALSREKKLAFECKAWSSGSVSIPLDQMRELISWCERGGAEPFIAWKFPREGWFFLKPEHFDKTGCAFNCTKRTALRHKIDLNVIAGRQATLKN